MFATGAVICSLAANARSVAATAPAERLIGRRFAGFHSGRKPRCSALDVRIRERAVSERRVPEIDTIHRVHMIAISGVAMTSLAGMLGERGLEVTGSDQNVYPPASTLLERLKIPVRLGYKPENLEPAPDLIIFGNPVSRTNPEVGAMLDRGLPYVSMPEAIRGFFLRGKRSLVVAGTHGKTTSTAMLACVLTGI